VSTDVSVASGALEPNFRNGRGRQHELRVDEVNLRRRCGDEREGQDVLSRGAALQLSRSVIRLAPRGLVRVGGQPVVVLGVVVIAVGVRVQPRRQAGGRSQRKDEQQRQDAAHPLSV